MGLVALARTKADRTLRAVRARLSRYLPSESQHVFALTLAIGLLCGLAAVGFHLAIRFAERHLIDKAMVATGNAWIAWTLLTPTVGGLLAGILLQYVVPLARGSGVPQVKEAYAIPGGRIRLRDVLGKFAVGALQIGSGASLGREGPTVQICAGVATALGRVTNLPEKSIRRLLPVGVAAGIAAAFNAPIAAVTFTIEEIVGNLDQTVLSGVVVAAALAAVIERSVLGIHPVIEISQPYGLDHASSLLLYAVLGLAAAGVSITFTDSLLRVRLWFRGVRLLPKWAHPAVGGLVTGALAVAALLFLHTRGVTGGGYETLSEALSGKLGLHILIALCVMKLVATVASYSSGGAGGIFAPALFIGAMLGGAVGFLDALILGHSTSTIGAFALVGMGAVFAGIIRAPITSVLIIFEMTGGYGLVLPLMLANMISYALARHWRPVPIYDALLEQDGVHLPKHRAAVSHALEKLRVADAMTSNPIALKGATTVREAVERLKGHGFSAVPVLDDADRLLGLVGSVRLRETNAAGGSQQEVAKLVQPCESISLDEPLLNAVLKMDQAAVRQLAVVARGDPKRLVGILSMSDVFRSHAKAAADASATVTRTVRVEDVMTQGRPFVSFQPRTPASEVLRHVGEATWQDVFPVIDGGMKIIGLVSSDAIKILALEHNDGLSWALATDVMQTPVVVLAGDDLRKATQLIVANSLREIPVVDGEQRVIGFLDEREVAKSLLNAPAAEPLEALR